MNRKQAKESGNVTYDGKPCKKCGTTLKYTSGWSCVECTKEAVRSRIPDTSKEYSARYIQSEKGKAWKREYEKTKTYRSVQNKWKKKDYKRNPDVYHKYSIKKYGMTKEQWELLFEQQNGKCSICSVLFSGSTRRPAVDHDHNTGAVRALLCSKCNTALGLLNEDISIMQSMINYVERFRCDLL